jgi:hypothetical protein
MRSTLKSLWFRLPRWNREALIPQVRVSNVDRTINERAQYRAILDRCVEDGKIGVLRSGRDCDCVSYDSSRIVDAPSGAVAFQREEDEHYSWLEGPESTSWAKPSQTIVQYHSRDLALEAFEDGHPHVIYV